MKVFCQLYWKILYKSLFVIGGIVGYHLFFPRLTATFYNYLTKHGFHDGAFQEFLKELPGLLVLFLWISAICAFLIDAFIMPRFSFGRAFIYRGEKCATWISSIGCWVAFINIFSTTKFDFPVKIWFSYMFILALLGLMMAILQGLLDARKNTAIAKRWQFEGMRRSKNGDF